MRKRFIFCVVCILLASCEERRLSIENKPREETEGQVDDIPPTNRGKVYITGVEYPQGYDWRSDPNSGYVECKLFLLEEGEKILELPIGREHSISADIDMHRVIMGELYTDYSSENETIIKKNGKELFRYPGRESMRGFLVENEDVYTLGYSRTGIGWSFRKNGEIILDSNNGAPTSELYRDGDRICFSYEERLGDSSFNVIKHFMVVDGIAQAIGSRSDISQIYNARMINSNICYMCRIYGVNVPFIFIGEESYIINFISAPTFKNIEIKNIDKEIYLCGYCIYENPDDPEGCYYKVFNNERIIDDFNWHRKIDVYTKTNTGRFAIGHRLGNKYFCEIYWNGSTDSIGLEHFYLGTKNSYLTTKEDTYALFANKNIDGKPLIWKNGEKSYYPINGFLSGVFQN